MTSIILQIPNGVAAALFAIGSVMIAKRIGRNTFTAISTSLVSLLGCILVVVIPGTPKLIGFYLAWAMTGTGALIQTLVSNNVSGYTKKVFYNGTNMVAMTLGNFIGPLMMTENQAPHYTGAIIGYAVSNAVLIVCLILIYFIMSKENARRTSHPPESETDVYLDLTDKQDRNIIYKL